MTVRYKVGHAWTDEIELVEVLRETASMVRVRERSPDNPSKLVESTYRKDSTHCQLFSTWDDARRYLAFRVTAEIEVSQGRIAGLEQRLQVINRMVPARLQ